MNVEIVWPPKVNFGLIDWNMQGIWIPAHEKHPAQCRGADRHVDDPAARHWPAGRAFAAGRGGGWLFHDGAWPDRRVLRRRLYDGRHDLHNVAGARWAYSRLCSVRGDFRDRDAGAA